MRITGALGDTADAFLDCNGVVKLAAETEVAFVERVAQRYTRDAILAVPAGPMTCAFRAVGDGDPSRCHLHVDWRSIFDASTRCCHEGAVDTMMRSLALLRSSLQQRERAPEVHIESDLPLPLALLVGYEWRMTTRMRVKVWQRTGGNYSLVDTIGDTSTTAKPVVVPLPGAGPAVVVVSVGSSVVETARRYAFEHDARRLILFDVPDFLSPAEARSLALDVTQVLAQLNDEGKEKHLILKGPASLAFTIGVGSNASGPVAVPFWNGAGYSSPIVIARGTGISSK